MTRDTKIVFVAVASIPVTILSAAMACSWAIASGASLRWRALFRPLCHGLVERSLPLWSVPMPICARCTGIYVGMLIGLLAFLVLPRVQEKTMRIVSMVAVTPLALDGFTQLFGLRESTNPLRIATGLVAGLCFGLWVLCAVQRDRDSVFTAS